VAEHEIGMSPEAATVLILGGSFGVVVMLMLAVVCCCGAAVAGGVGATDCDQQPPDPRLYPEAYARWLRECKHRRRNQVTKLVQMQTPAETAALVQWP